MSKAKILLVEDNKTEAKITKAILERHDYEVTWIEEGSGAIKIAKTTPIDLVLLDVQLPDLNGNEVCRWLKMNSSTRTLPIIMLTVRGSVADKVSGFQAGADDYLPKPYDEIELNARIYAALRNKALHDELADKNRELEAMLERVEVMAITDSLTELYNRRRFEILVEKEFIRTKRYDTPLSCMMIDIDFFKRVNDTHGHRVGDLVLREVATIIKRAIREVDTAARWGGEEFVVLMPETEKSKSLEPAQRILNSVAGHTFSDFPDLKITVSLGVAGAPAADIDTGEKLINLSDFAMYESKRKGRNRFEIL